MNIAELIDHPPREDDPVDLTADVMRRIRRPVRRPLVPGSFIVFALMVSAVLACGLDWAGRLRPLSALPVDVGWSWSSTVSSGPAGSLTGNYGQPMDLLIGLMMGTMVVFLVRRMVLA